MLKFASICPHPPIIIPTIGSKSDLNQVSETIKALKKLNKIFKKSNIETLLVVSPHGPVDFFNFTITISENLIGNLEMFGNNQTKIKLENDLELIKKIKNDLNKNNIPYRFVNSKKLDHGTLVPLYYLLENIEKLPRIIPIAYSLLGPRENFNFGKIIYSTIQKEKKKIGFVASGDLSHRLSITAPAGYSPYGKIFDKKLIELLREKDIEGILNLDKNLVREAGECGYFSICILLGLISNIKKSKIEDLSYEGPFGVGYLVANVKGL